MDKDLLEWQQKNYKYKINLLDKDYTSKKMLKMFKTNFKHLLSQIKELHDMDIGHFDIKLDNIMVKFKPESRRIEKRILIDYGLAGKPPIFQIKGTPGFIDPECVIPSIAYLHELKRPLILKSDIWSLGIVIFQCIFNTKGPFVVNYQKN